MSNEPAKTSEPAKTPAKPSADVKSESVPVGTLRLSGIVRTRNGFAVAQVDLTVEEWEAIAKKKIGKSQAFKEYVAMEHKGRVLALGQLA